jgi:hypothetical protein
VTSAEQRVEGVLAARAPGRFAGYLGMLCGAGLIVLAVRIWIGDNAMPPALPVGLGIVGVAQIACARFALRRVRAAWAFALSINATAFLIFLFGAPKLRDAAEVSIALALLPAVVFAAITTLYALSADEY